MSQTLSQKDLEHLGVLARIEIRESEKEKMLRDVQAILAYMSEINEMTTSEGGVAVSPYNITRDDEVTHTPGELNQSLLECVPQVHEGYVQVTQVLK